MFLYYQYDANSNIIKLKSCIEDSRNFQTFCTPKKGLHEFGVDSQECACKRFQDKTELMKLINTPQKGKGMKSVSMEVK